MLSGCLLVAEKEGCLIRLGVPWDTLAVLTFSFDCCDDDSGDACDGGDR